MATNAKTLIAARNRALDAAFDVLDSGKFKVYDSSQPTDCDTALGAQVLLANLPMNADSFAAASAASKAANAITNDSSADATGTATWVTMTTSGDQREIDGSAGTSGANANFNSVAISSGAAVACSAATITMAA